MKLKLSSFKMKRPSSSGILSTKTIKRGMPGERSGRLHIDEEHLNDTSYGYGYLHDPFTLMNWRMTNGKIKCHYLILKIKSNQFDHLY